MPIASAPGSTPTSVVANPIISSVMIRVALRPMRSPQWPKMNAPTGRAANPMAYVAKDSSRPAYVEDSGKNSAGKTSAAAVL